MTNKTITAVGITDSLSAVNAFLENNGSNAAFLGTQTLGNTLIFLVGWTNSTKYLTPDKSIGIRWGGENFKANQEASGA